YGPFQFPEKLIPLMATNALEGEPLPVYGDGLYVRDWIHVEDHCEGVMAALNRGAAGEVYNFGGDAERTNLQVIHGVIQAVGCSPDLIRRVKDRPGHDRRYAVDARKAAEALEWTPRMDFEEGLVQTVDWYRENEAWWQRVKSGEYREYYRRRYGAQDD
ncbi:MAG: dTDP-glucose 4,6-dehydratase, partial [Longimicrobiales bacterium]